MHWVELTSYLNDGTLCYNTQRELINPTRDSRTHLSPLRRTSISFAAEPPPLRAGEAPSPVESVAAVVAVRQVEGSYLWVLPPPPFHHWFPLPVPSPLRRSTGPFPMLPFPRPKAPTCLPNPTTSPPPLLSSPFAIHQSPPPLCTCNPPSPFHRTPPPFALFWAKSDCAPWRTGFAADHNGTLDSNRDLVMCSFPVVVPVAMALPVKLYVISLRL
ncbi:hypothetical protein Taro_024743 [Colocasia esculenta]|uniref:Uncharacterized protein n=1 Tax=Colocasia esculenta TaxID=4460 RepID=A0A843V172_COLES|nr:hypothetical protein [Colocasia esculenta]